MAQVTESDRQPGSGSGLRHKEDLLKSEALQQVKSSRGESLSIKLVDLELLIQNTRKLNRKDGGDRVPKMILHFVTDRAVLGPRAWALVPLEAYQNHEHQSERDDEDLGGDSRL